MNDRVFVDLTVVVPTYERVEKLFELINDLAKAQKSVDFSVIIVNDMGPETAYEQTYQFAKDHLRALKMSRNDSNLGIDHNIDRCLSAANTEYVMAIGDDDRLNVPNFINFLRKLTTLQSDLVVLEYSYIYDDLTMQQDRVIDFRTDQDLESLSGKRQFLFDKGTKLGFLGSVLFRTQAYRSHASPRFLGTWFNHVGAALDILFDDSCQVTWFDQPIVLNRAGDIRVTSWSHRIFDVIDGWWRMMALSCDSHGKCTLLEYREHKSDVTFQYDNAFWMVSRRAENLISFETLPILFRTFDLSTKTKAMYYIACLLPPKLCLVMKKSARIIGQ